MISECCNNLALLGFVVDVKFGKSSKYFATRENMRCDND